MDVKVYIAFLFFTSSVLSNPLPESEKFRSGGDGAMITQTPEYPDVGYLVLVDYSQDVVIIKDTTSEKCFYSHLRRYTFLKNDNKNRRKGDVTNDFSVTDDVAKHVLESWQDGSFYLENFSLTGSIQVPDQCIGRPSFWMIEDINRGRRDALQYGGSDQMKCCTCRCCSCSG